MVAALADLDHPDAGVVRWTPPSRWHITLVFLGELAPGARSGGQAAGGGDDTVDDAVARLGRVPVADHAPTVARLGAVTRSFGRSVLYVPVTGLDALAASVRTAYASIGPRCRRSILLPGPLVMGERSEAHRLPGPRAILPRSPATSPLGRSRRHRDDLRSLAGMPVGAAGGMAWTVDELALVASISMGAKGRYETVATVSVPGDDHPTSNMRSGLQ